MIKLIKAHSYLGDVYLNPALIAAIDFQKGDAYVRAGNTDYRMSHEEAYALIEKLQGKEEQQGALVMTKITSIQRDETKNNQRPMWRCKTETGEKVNIFLNVDEISKDNFHLFEAAGWGDYLMGLFLYSEAFTEISIAMRKDGQWWNIVSVSPAKSGIDSYEVPSEADGEFDPEIYGNKDISDDLGLEVGNESD